MRTKPETPVSTTMEVEDISTFFLTNPDLRRQGTADIAEHIDAALKYKTLHEMVGTEFEGYPIEVLLKGIVQQLGKAVTFDYGSKGSFVDTHIDFCREMLSRESFVLPYEPCAIKIRNPEGSIDWYMVTAPIKDAPPVVIAFPPLEIGGARRRAGFFPGIVLRCDLEKDNIEGNAIISTPGAMEFFRDNLSFMYYTPLCAIAALMSQGVTVDRVDTSERINKLREVRGRPRIGPRYTVKVHTDSTIYNSKGGYQSTGTRKPPEIHWRRGHFRKLGEENVIPVKPCVVGATSDDISEVGKKMYEVLQSRCREKAG